MMNYEYDDGYAIYDYQIIVNTLYMFLDAFPIYADVAKEYFPKEIYLLNAFHTNSMQMGGLSLKEPDVILFYADQYSNRKILYHEMAHIYLYKNSDAYILKQCKEVSGLYCNIVSDYACTNEDERFAEVVSYAMAYKKQNTYTEALSDFFKENINYFENGGGTKYYVSK